MFGFAAQAAVRMSNMRARSIFMAHTGIKFKANAKRKRLNAAVKIQRQSLVGLWKKIYEKLAFVVMAVMSLLVLSVVVVASYASRGCTSKQDNMVETHTHTLTRNESKLAHTYTHAEKSPRTEWKCELLTELAFLPSPHDLLRSLGYPLFARPHFYQLA